MAKDHEFSDEELEKIQEYADAFRQEFEASQDVAPKKQYTKEDVDGQLDEAVPDAIAAINFTLKHSRNESLKIKVAQWLIDQKVQIERDSKDPLVRFLGELTDIANKRDVAEVTKPGDAIGS